MGEAHWRLVTPCPPGVTNCVTGHWSAVTARLRPGARLGPGLHSEVPAPTRYSHPTHEGHGDTGTRGQCDKTQVREGVSWHWRLESWSCMWPQRAGAGRRHGAALRGALGRARGHGRGQHADTCDQQSSMHFSWFRCHQTTQKGRNLDPTIWKYIPLPTLGNWYSERSWWSKQSKSEWWLSIFSDLDSRLTHLSLLTPGSVIVDFIIQCRYRI